MSVTTEPVFDIAVSRDVGAPPDVLYGLITDLTKVGEHSPETISASWIEGDTARVGSRFKRSERRSVDQLSWLGIS